MSAGWIIFAAIIGGCTGTVGTYYLITRRHDRRATAKQARQEAELDDFLHSLHAPQAWVPYTTADGTGTATEVGIVLLSTDERRVAFDRRVLKVVSADPIDDYADRLAEWTREAMRACYESNAELAR